MGEFPSGTVTFLFTDIEGSTKLLEAHGERYAEVLEEHRRVLREALCRHGGVEVDTQGDAFFVAFARALDAVAAAEKAQSELEIPVRIGIHTGEPQLTKEGYVGMDVHRAARICAAAHGRQVVLSESSVAQLEGEPQLIDLGLHRLKDLGEPVKLYQVGKGEFPPLRSLNATNLPAQPGPLVGRAAEVAALTDLLGAERVVTLTGPGGSGKTRLALQVAAEAVDAFVDGVFWVPLAAVTDPEIVETTISETIGARDGLANHVDEKRMLLLLDNLEQLLPEVAPALAALLERCPNLRLLLTSRAPLRIAGEREYAVEPLPEEDAVSLFRERAFAVEPEDAVREICRRLDRLPLAIELAAARTRLLAPDKLLERLAQALPVLTAGRRDADERQRTLHATIEWSYDLLNEEEQKLFRRLAVFGGSFAIEAAEEVCDADMETLESLLEQSLVRRWASGRLGMLETIREYAAERLRESGESSEVGRRHAHFFLELAESAQLSMDALYAGGTPQLDIVRPEQGNVRTALEWALEHDPELGLRLAIALDQFWVTQNPVEAMRRLEALLERVQDAPPALLGRAYRSLGGTSWFSGDNALAKTANERSFELFREAGDEHGQTTMLFRLGTGCLGAGDDEGARRLLEESLDGFRRLRSRMGECEALGNLGWLELFRGDRRRGRELTEQSIEIARELDWAWWEASKLADLAEVALEEGRTGEAETLARAALTLSQELQDRVARVYVLALFAWIAAQRGRAARAGRLWGAIEAEEARGRIGAWEEEWRDVYAPRIHEARGPAFEAGRAEGSRLTLDEAVELALADA